MKDYSQYLSEKINNLSEDFISEFKQNYFNNRKENLDKIYSGILTKNEIRALIQKLNLSRGTLTFYTNGVVDIKLPKNTITVPEGFHFGRTNGCDINTKNFKWYNDGTKNYLLSPDDPRINQLKLGTLSKSTLGYKFYTDGKTNIYLPNNAEIPEGFTHGQTASTKRKADGLNRRKTKYNNGENEISLFKTDKIPDGYVKGKLTKEIKRKFRDDKYFNLGYLPLHVLKEKYGTVSWFKHLCDLDIIRLEDPYVYVNKKEIPRIEEYIRNCSSYGEHDVLNYLNYIYKGEILLHSRSVLGNGKELDFYIPEFKLAIEFDGIWYHSNWYKDNDYHLNKTKLCEEKGIRLIHIFEDLWIKSPEIYKSILSLAVNKIENKIFARKCEFKEVPKSEEKEFLTNNHLHGYVNSSKCFGLYYNGELVQLISFGKNRFKSNEIELLRMCSKLNTEVVGGFSKLIKNSGIKEFISYVDRSTFNSKGYLKTGFTFISYSKPSYVYFKKDILTERLNRLAFQKHKLSNKLNNYDKNKTEIENMDMNGYIRVYDCGTIKLKYKIE